MSKESLISFKCNCDFIFVILYWLCEFGFRLFMYIGWDFFQIAEKDSDNEYLYIFFLNIADLIGAVELVRKFKKKTEYANKHTINPLPKFLILSALFILDLFARSLFYIFHRLFDIDNEEVSQKFLRDMIIIVDVLLRVLSNTYIIEKESAAHKIFPTISLLVIIVLLIIMDLINLFTTENYDISYCFLYIGILLPRSIIFPINDIIAKKLLDKNYIFPLEYMGYRFLYELVLLLIITPILIATSNLHFSSDIFSKNLAIVGPVYTITSSIKSYLLLKVIYKFKAQSVAFLIISESLAVAIYEVIDFFNDTKKKSRTLNIVLYIFEIILIILIGIVTMVHEEIIIIRICELDKNVRAEIEKRRIEDEGLARLTGPIAENDEQDSTNTTKVNNKS